MTGSLVQLFKTKEVVFVPRYATLELFMTSFNVEKQIEHFIVKSSILQSNIDHA